MYSNLLLRKGQIAHISPKTVRYCLTDVRLNVPSPASKPFIFKKNKTKSLGFAKAYNYQTFKNLKKVLWSDKSKFKKVAGKKIVHEGTAF